MSESEFLIDKHVKYLTLCLNMFPSKYEDQDCNKLSLICFSLQGLEILHAMAFTDEERSQFIDFIYSSYFIGNGFRDTMNSGGTYDQPTVSSTFFGLLNLVMLKHQLNDKIDRQEVMKFLSACQIKEGDHKGSFSPTLSNDGGNFGETDLRICYMALGIRRILQYDTAKGSEDDIDVDAVVKYILKKWNVDGGFACVETGESNSGYTFCAIASLKLAGYDFSSTDWNSTLDWILHRQINYPDSLYDGNEVNHQDFGGFNGRENKPGDSCYSWWNLGALDILGHLKLANVDAASQFLLLNQDHRVGGIAKNFESRPDPYHSFLSICSLAIMKDTCKFKGSGKLQPVDPILTVPQSSIAFIDSINW